MPHLYKFDHMTSPLRIACVSSSDDLSQAIGKNIKLHLGNVVVERFASLKEVTTTPLPDLLLLDCRELDHTIPNVWDGVPTLLVSKRRNAPGPRLQQKQHGFTEHCLAEDVTQPQFAALIHQLIERARLNRALGEAQSLLRDRRIRDDLTGLYNRRTFTEIFTQAVKRANRYKTPISLVIFDLDDLRELGARYGHAASENAVKVFAELLRQTIREVDIASRLEFDVYAVALPETNIDQARILAERVRRGLHHMQSSTSEQLPLPTVSIGINGLNVVRCTPERLIETAQQALLTAKHKGGNQVVVWEQPQDNTSEMLASKETVNHLRTEISAFTSEIQQDYFEHLVALFEKRPAYTKHVLAHAKRVANWSTLIAKALGWRQSELNVLKRAALLHDIGLAAFSQHLLAKTSPLDKSEEELIQQHPIIGVQLLEKTNFIREELAIILHHHERFDGNGYPDRLSGNYIPIGARIVAIAEAWERMTQDQPYRLALTNDQATTELMRGAGRQFDPDLTATFLNVLAA